MVPGWRRRGKRSDSRKRSCNKFAPHSQVHLSAPSRPHPSIPVRVPRTYFLFLALACTRARAWDDTEMTSSLSSSSTCVGALKILWLMLTLVILVDASPVKKVRRTPAGFRYSRDLKAESTGQGGGGGNKHLEEGIGTKHDVDHHNVHGHDSDKGYKVFHEFEKNDKGHHDDEKHERKYNVENGVSKKKHDELGHYDEVHHDEEGVKNAKFGEEGKHQKGYSTKGEHSVFKKDEYEKKHDFYDEYHEDGGHEKHGGWHEEHEAKKGGHEKTGHLQAGHHEGHHGSGKKYDGGHHHHEKGGHKAADGHSSHHEHDEKHGHKGGYASGHKWSQSNHR